MKPLSVKLGVILFIIGFAIFGYSEAFSFDIDGFKSGMTKKEVKEMIEEWKGYSIEEQPESISLRSISQPMRFMTFVFRNSRLYNYWKTIEPSMRNFIMLFNQFTGLYGKPFDSHSEIRIDAYGEAREISFWWQIGSETVRLKYCVFPTNDQLDVMYSTSERR